MKRKGEVQDRTSPVKVGVRRREWGAQMKKGRNGQFRELNPVNFDMDSGKILKCIIKQLVSSWSKERSNDHSHAKLNLFPF